MNEKQLMAEFAANIKSNFSQLQDLFKAYDLAVLGYDMHEQQCKEAYNKTLQNTPFYAAKGCERCGIEAGERITNEFYSFLLSAEDFNRYCDLNVEELTRQGITDERGYYVTDWLGIKGDARRKLVAFIIDELLPWEMRLQFKPQELNITITDKLLNIVRPIVTKAA